MINDLFCVKKKMFSFPNAASILSNPTFSISYHGSHLCTVSYKNDDDPIVFSIANLPVNLEEHVRAKLGSAAALNDILYLRVSPTKSVEIRELGDYAKQQSLIGEKQLYILKPEYHADDLTLGGTPYKKHTRASSIKSRSDRPPRRSPRRKRVARRTSSIKSRSDRPPRRSSRRRR